jgi:hypothetical protein
MQNALQIAAFPISCYIYVRTVCSEHPMKIKHDAAGNQNANNITPIAYFGTIDRLAKI